MDYLMLRIVELLLLNNFLTEELMLEELGLKKNQLNYRVNKINKLLNKNNLPNIIKNKHVYTLTMDKESRIKFQKLLTSIIQYPSEIRENFLILLIIYKDNQDLYTLSDALNVSKNTVLLDLKNIEAQLHKISLTMNFSRKIGYEIKGNELDIRNLCLSIISKELLTEVSFNVLTKLLIEDRELLDDIYIKLEKFENKLNLSFSEIKLWYLGFVIYLSIHRSERYILQNMYLEQDFNKLLEQDFFDNISEIFSVYFKKKDTNLKDELIFITMQLLSTNLIRNDFIEDDIRLMKAIEESIDLFEKFSVSFIKNKSDLKEILYKHIIPASYRIKTGLFDDNGLYNNIFNEYEEYFPLVKRSIEPIEKELDISFDKELSYLVIIFVGSLMKSQNSEKKIKNAVVVCMHGSSVSKLLLNKLQVLFPYIFFEEHLSIRDFYKKNPKVDLIFTTVSLNTQTPKILVSHYLSDKEKLNLKKQVESKLFNLDNISIINNSIDNLIEIVQKYATVHSENLLKTDLNKYLNSNQYDFYMSEDNRSNHKNTLKKLLLPEHIQIVDQELDFENAIRLSGKPLIRKNIIKKDYIETIINDYDSNFPYFVIAPGVAIPHSSPEKGVNQLGISLLVLKKSVPFSNNLYVNMIFMIAPKDRTSHLTAITELYNLVSQDKIRKQIISEKYEKGLYNLFQQICQ